MLVFACFCLFIILWLQTCNFNMQINEFISDCYPNDISCYIMLRNSNFIRQYNIYVYEFTEKFITFLRTMPTIMLYILWIFIHIVLPEMWYNNIHILLRLTSIYKCTRLLSFCALIRLHFCFAHVCLLHFSIYLTMHLYILCYFRLKT